MRQRYVPLILICLLLILENASSAAANSSRLPRIRVHSDGHYLETDDGKPFFWLADTAWQLIQGTTREECSYYLHTRARQGYTVIQTVALAEFGGVSQPTALNLMPFENGDPSRPNEAYFDRVAEIVDEANSLGLYIGLLPTWGDKVTPMWGAGPVLFRNDNLRVARDYARYLGNKLKGKTNVIWILGGDRPPRIGKTENRQGEDWRPIWREFANGIEEGSGGRQLITYHPAGGSQTSTDLHSESWLSINGMQSGHGGGHDVPVWEWVSKDYNLTPAKPTLDLEPNYEDHPYNPWPRWDPSTGYFRDHDVRKQLYRSVFAGAAGVTYGHHAIWGFVGTRNDVINHADRDWIDAMFRPAGTQAIFLRQLIESRPFFTRIPDQSLIVGDAGLGGLHLQATRDKEGTYAFIYFPMNDQNANIDLSKLRSREVRAWWFDPRTGVAAPIGNFEGGTIRNFRTPPYGPDWVLVLEDPAGGYAPPGLRKTGK